MALPLDHLDLLDAPAQATPGVPFSLPIDDIDEDPAQPRQEFDDESLAELAETIRQRGVRQPISVRRHPAQPDRWMLNFGARRLRASKLAGKPDIPAFVDEGTDDYDQVIENEQREGLRPFELALFIKKRLAANDSQAEIARRLGKSKSLISMVGALIDPPDWLHDAYRSGRCVGIAELYELRRLHETEPDAVQAMLARPGPITRTTMRSHRDERSTVEPPDDVPPADAGRPRHAPSSAQAASASAPHLLRRAELLCAELDATVARLRPIAPDGLAALRARIAAIAAA